MPTLSAESPAIYHRIHRGQQDRSPGLLAIGSFDGVHLGHQAIIGDLVEQARQLNCCARVLTFYPRPAEFFAPGKTLPGIMGWREKVEFIASLGVDEVLCVPFNRRLSQLPAEKFIKDILVEQLRARRLIVGADFNFGRDRLGSVAMLQEWGPQLGFEVQVAQTVAVQGERVSSTAIRKALVAGEMDHASRLLGRPYSLSGRVVRGAQLGRQWGIPTANLNLKGRRLCAAGVFVGNALVDSVRIPAAINIGHRPAVDSLPRPVLEAHLLDFNADLYGKRLEVELLHKIRDEVAFDSLELLRQQIETDVKTARQWHAASLPE